MTTTKKTDDLKIIEGLIALMDKHEVPFIEYGQIKIHKPVQPKAMPEAPPPESNPETDDVDPSLYDAVGGAFILPKNPPT